MGGAGWRSLNVCLWSICKTFWIIDDFVDFFYCYWCCGYPGACATAPPRRRGSWRLATRTTNRATPSLHDPCLIIIINIIHIITQHHHCLAPHSADRLFTFTITLFVDTTIGLVCTGAPPGTESLKPPSLIQNLLASRDRWWKLIILILI